MRDGTTSSCIGELFRKLYNKFVEWCRVCVELEEEVGGKYFERRIETGLSHSTGVA